jgi:triacylglycerol esterase/lipase EstA (alpha/beta hydrolase family)
MRDANHVYLIPGFFGFANLGQLTYFGHVRDFLARRCAAAGLDVRIHVVRTIPTASLARRAARVVETVAATLPPRAGVVHLVGHSSGGLDARLAATPAVSLPTRADVEVCTRRLRSVITVATPHYGTPLAAFFTSLLGQQVLRELSLSTVYVLRFGHLPLGALFARLDDVATSGGLLDDVFRLLLGRFSVGRRRAVQLLFGEIANDQALLVQLTPEAMEVFNAAVRDRPGVAYASLAARASRPGLVSTMATGIDPAAQAMHAVYGGLYRLATRTDRRRAAVPSRPQARLLRHAYGAVPPASANDGIVPTRSQVWGELIGAFEADHLDVIGHFHEPSHDPPHVDWLTTGSGFTREAFEAAWGAVVDAIGRSRD